MAVFSGALKINNEIKMTFIEVNWRNEAKFVKHQPLQN